MGGGVGGFEEAHEAFVGDLVGEEGLEFLDLEEEVVVVGGGRWGGGRRGGLELGVELELFAEAGLEGGVGLFDEGAVEGVGGVLFVGEVLGGRGGGGRFQGGGGGGGDLGTGGGFGVGVQGFVGGFTVLHCN